MYYSRIGELWSALPLGSAVKVILRGGLGNQLFAWAAGFALSQRLSVSLNLYPQLIVRNDPELLDPRHFDLDYFGFSGDSLLPSRLVRVAAKGGNRWTRALYRPIFGDVFRESGFEYDERFSRISGPVTLDGYFQSWRYFHSYAERVKFTLTSSQRRSTSAQILAKRLRREPWVGVHVRRGDYVKVGAFELPGEDYYLAAISMAKSASGASRVVVFSDDVAQARSVVKGADEYIGGQAIALAGDVVGLLSESTAFVGANSSLSWWAAYLHENRGALRIFPRTWFTDSQVDISDLLLPEWKTVGG